MQKKLIEHIDNIENFFKSSKEAKNLNVTQELLYTLIQMIDIEDDSVGIAKMMTRLSLLTQMNLDGYEQFSQDYFAKTGTFIAGFMEFLSEVLMSGESEKVQKGILALSNHLKSKLPKASEKEIIEELLREFMDKVQRLSKEKAIEDEAILVEISQNLSENNIKKLLTFESSQHIAMILGASMSLIPMIAMVKNESVDDVDWDMDEDEMPSLEDMEVMLKAKMNESDEELYERREFGYALGKKPICNLCDKAYTQQGIKRHINGCIDKLYEKGNEELTYLTIKDDEDARFYLHIVIKSSATLSNLDIYLREIWLECCGHMSAFFHARQEFDVSVSIEEVFSKVKKLDYTYDFGSSTNLTIEFVKSFKGKQDLAIKTMTRNSSISRNCDACRKRKIVAVCSQCFQNEEEEFFCKECMQTHECGMDMMLPYVNSPRMGVCGYGEWEEIDGLDFYQAEEVMEIVEKG